MASVSDRSPRQISQAPEYANRELVVCIAEDRPSCEPALRILVASLTKQCPGISAYLFCPNASIEFEHWTTKFPGITLNARVLDGPWSKYDIKPLALLTMLKSGFENVLWIDSDILIADDFRPLFRDLPAETIAVTEEALCSGHADPEALRARLWGMEVGRALPFTANTGVIRVTAQHQALLERWRDLLESPVYREAQKQPWSERGLHLMGDQEVFTALLASREYTRFPIRFIRRGADIVQYFGFSGYTIGERLGHLRRGMPPFVHSQGFSPWWPRRVERSMAGRFRGLYNELSPYTALARGYAHELGDAAWLKPRSRLAAILTGIGCGSAPLTGLPLALPAEFVRLYKAAGISLRRRMFRRPSPDDRTAIPGRGVAPVPR